MARLQAALLASALCAGCSGTASIDGHEQHGRTTTSTTGSSGGTGGSTGSAADCTLPAGTYDLSVALDPVRPTTCDDVSAVDHTTPVQLALASGTWQLQQGTARLFSPGAIDAACDVYFTLTPARTETVTPTDGGASYQRNTQVVYATQLTSSRSAYAFNGVITVTTNPDHPDEDCEIYTQGALTRRP